MTAPRPVSTTRRLVLLPGMDGTGLLFAPFVAAAPPGIDIDIDVVAIPETMARYDDIVAALAPRVAAGPDTVLLAESFSGPVALRLAAAARPSGVILVNSFVRSPIAASLHRLARPTFFRLPPPARALKHFLLGSDADASLVAALREAMRHVKPAVMAERVAAIGGLDASADLARVECPLLYLRGDDDRLVGEASVEAIVAQSPRVEVQRIPGPHLLLQAQPAAAWRAIQPFINRVWKR